jgi:hypothetical protein
MISGLGRDEAGEISEVVENLVIEPPDVGQVIRSMRLNFGRGGQGGRAR